jgi:hypothetical protein
MPRPSKRLRKFYDIDPDLRGEAAKTKGNSYYRPKSFANTKQFQTIGLEGFLLREDICETGTELAA